MTSKAAKANLHTFRIIIDHFMLQIVLFFLGHYSLKMTNLLTHRNIHFCFVETADELSTYLWFWVEFTQGIVEKQASKQTLNTNELFHPRSQTHSLMMLPWNDFTHRFQISVSSISHLKHSTKLEFSALFHSSRSMRAHKEKREKSRFLARHQCCLLISAKKLHLPPLHPKTHQ